MGADGAVLTGDSIASGFDTRLNKKALMAYGPMKFGGAPVLSQITPDMVARIFPGAPRANIEKYWPIVRKALAERDLVDKTMVLMALATVRVETFTFAPVSEEPSPLNTQPPGRPFNKYDRRSDLGNLGPPDGARFKGRGFIQLTGRKNYEFYGDLLGYNLIGNPELANTPQPAARILAAYLKENEPIIRSALAAGDLAAARKTVNGGGNGLDGFRVAFMLGNKMVRDKDSDLAFLKEEPGRREIKKVKAVSISNPASRSAKSSAKKRDDDDVMAKKRDDDKDGNETAKKKKDDDKDRKAIAKKRDDDKDGKTKEKKKDDDKEGNKETDGKGKKKGFFLVRLFRSFS
jgi:putative chitinase